MVYRKPRFEGEFIGPLTIKHSHPNAKFESVCHICRWATFEWQLDTARTFLLWHIDTTHINPPEPTNLTAAQMPGR